MLVLMPSPGTIQFEWRARVGLDAIDQLVLESAGET